MEYDSAGSVRELQANLFPPIVPRNTNSVGENINIPSILIAPRFDSTLQTNFTNRNDKIKEPRDLFEIPSHSARWPVECQVLHERVEHIEYTPPTPEPYYESSESDPTPPPIGEGGTIVFNYHPISPVCYYSRSTIGGSRPITPSSLERNCLHFESRFESGNLAKAVRITENYYELYLRADMYTNRHQQWFYFKISNTRRNTTYRLSIVNLAKADSLYNEGMRPLLYSSRDARLHSIGWRRCGNNIAYYQNEIPTEETDDSVTYTLSFTIEFPHDRDDVYIAHCYPYTYTDLQEYLTRIATHPVKSTFSTLRLLCRSLAGNNIYYLTITSPSSIFPSSPDVQRPKKRAIVLTARVHPGESPSSWMMKGMIDFLTGDSNPARELREKFIFKLIPMLNPDGVIVGNSRCSLTGRDLNRQYRTVIRETYPSVWHTKLMIRRLIEECGVAMYCDLHAHSRKHNIFMYGCETKRHSESKLQEQVFPLMLHKNSPDKFSFEDCKFRIQRSKEGTGRVVIWLLGVANSYTLEASFGGSQIGSRTTTHFTTQDYEAIGKSFCETLLDFSDDHPNKEKLRMKIVTKLLKGGSSADEPTNITLSDYSSDEGDTSSSDSEERLDCRFTSMQAPPPSPMPPKRTSRKTKPARIKAGRSPKLQREILPTLDWPTTDPGSDYYDSADERLGVLPTKRLGRTRTRYGDGFRSDCEHMPPELTIISNLENKTFNGRSQSVIDLGMAERRNKPSWHRLRSLPPPNRHIKPQPSEVQVKLTSLRQRIWTGISLNKDSPISWGLSVLAATAYQNDCEALLKSCSQKLFAFKKQNDSSKKNGLGQTKIKKKVKVVKSHTVDEVTTQKEKNNNKKPQKLKRQKAVTEVKIEPVKPDKIPIRSSTSMTNSRKLVKQKPVMNSIEKESENEETINKRTVKKKKKRKKNAS